MDNKNIRNSKGNLFQSVKGKILIMGILGIAAAFIIGIVGVTSINKNARISEIVSLVNEISLLQSMNIANDAQYQHYVEEKYLDDTLTNLDEMDKKASDLKAIADQSYAASINSVIENVSKNKTNYTDLKALHSERGYDTSTGKYKEYNDASTALMDSFGTLVNNNDWVEIPWQIDTFEISANPVKVDGKEYTKVVYEKLLPKIGKRNNLSFRVGGTFTYKGDFYIKDIEFKNGSDSIAVDLSVLDTIEKSGDGLGDVEFADFDGGKAIKVTGNYDSANDKWEEISTTISIIDQDINKYPTLKYDIYFDNSVINPGDTYQYGGAITGVYQFAGNLSNLNGMVATYSKHVVEGKDVSSELQAIEGLMANIQENIPQYTTDPSLADASNGFLENQKSIFSALKANDEKALKIKADNSVINTDLSNLCSNIQSEAIAQMNTVKTSVTIIILAVLVISIVILALILIRVSVGINNSVKSFSSAIDEIANGNISARANETGKDEFALFAMNLNGFMDTLEATMSKVKDVTQVLADSGIKLQESASKTKNVASEINDTISEISKGAGEQAKDIETSSQRIVDIGTNIREILSNVTNLSSKSDAISLSGKEASENMEKLNKSSDSANEAFSRIAEQINKTDESVGKIQDAVSLIASVANQINLLSLNASIEAARAGEAGKGFAVVASEISHLADQTNESTNIIGGIIKDLTEESNRTVTTINEVTEKINEQKSNIDSTSEIFGGVSTGIDFTKEAVEAVLVQAEACEKSSDTVVDLMTNLSAISEENAASAETTSTAMTELNAETAKLAETSAELKELADNLKEDLEFFKIATK